MLSELRVRELGVIADLDVRLGRGLTVITGETGAGKTLVIEALELLVGGRAEGAMVRQGAEEAIVEGRFVTGEAPDDEIVVMRSVPREGRSRATLNGQMATLAALADLGAGLVDLHGQHAHQSLLRPAVQRQALDAFAGVDLTEVQELRRALSALDRRIADLGGDDRARARELDLLRFELGEIEQAAIAGESEEDELAGEEERLAGATQLREAAEQAHEAVEGDGGGSVLDTLGAALAALDRHQPLAGSRARLAAAAAELADVASELRRAAEDFEEDPERLAFVRGRRELLRRLIRKHGEGLADVLGAAREAGARIAELERADEERESALLERALVAERLAEAEVRVGDRRRAAALPLATEVEGHLASLALAGARLVVQVPAEGIGDEVELLLSANRGEAELPLAKIASGGELARVMLALRLVLSSAPPTLVFDEVDAGIGGEAALAVGAALHALAAGRQVFVVTHLAQVAAYANLHLVLEKAEEGARTVSRLRPVEGEERVVELSRMLSGHPDSAAARLHAAELLEMTGRAAARASAR
ncbi:MAG TPA: DNA repair protein RecN [Acidimicrobiales bacterium]|nr:DNA repair protein RecN [Acidimicrobiales bacterium]